MAPYWFLFIFAAILALTASRLDKEGRVSRLLNTGTVWWGLTAALTVMIGLRNKVGGDWYSYLFYLSEAGISQFHYMITELPDPGYQLFNWVSYRMGWGIWGVNLACGLIFSMGLMRFCRSMPRPWLALTVAVPYLVIVVGMGYSRQGVALGFGMLGIVALLNQRLSIFVIWVLLAASFHKTAALLLPVAALIHTRHRLWTLFWVGITSLAGYYLFLAEYVGKLYDSYMEAEYNSNGAFIRLLMNALPALVLLIWRNNFHFPEVQKKLWLYLSLISLGLFLVLFISPSSTAVDRVALYILPLQLVIFSYFPDAFGRTEQGRYFLLVGVVAYYAFVQLVWLNFASMAFAWIPYGFYKF